MRGLSLLVAIVGVSNFLYVLTTGLISWNIQELMKAFMFVGGVVTLHAYYEVKYDGFPPEEE